MNDIDFMNISLNKAHKKGAGLRLTAVTQANGRAARQADTDF
jgi:hypothetical protein